MLIGQCDETKGAEVVMGEGLCESRPDPFLSVIIPVRNGGMAFDRCLSALSKSSFDDFELIVVDDASEDDSVAVARGYGAQVVRNHTQAGAPTARNLGAASAQGVYLFFLDADCVVGEHTLARTTELLREDPELAALFGSYDDSPEDPGVVSQYRNLLHHWVHQHGNENASTFWTGCGAVRRSLFQRLGGFDPQQGVDDIELGWRIRESGGRIRLAKDVLVTHHKGWTFTNMLRTDILMRAMPWTELILERGALVNDLNVDLRNRSGVVAVAVLVACSLFAFVWPWFCLGSVVSGLWLAVVNRDLYRFFANRRGPRFVLTAMVLHWLYFLSSGIGLVLGVSRFVWRRTGVDRQPDSSPSTAIETHVPVRTEPQSEPAKAEALDRATRVVGT